MFNGRVRSLWHTAAVDLRPRALGLRLWHGLRSVSALDYALLIIALVLASFTLTFPYGRDQGLYHYVGRAWFDGALPYRDVMDQKTPIIYLAFGLANTLFGEHLWSIRLLELLWTAAIGWALASGAAQRGSVAATGVRGAGALVVCALYFGTLSYWDTAQCEIWYSGFTFLSLSAVQRFERPRLGPLWAGVWTGLSCLAKPPAVFLALVVVLALVSRMAARSDASQPASLSPRLKRTGAALLWFGLGALLPLLITLAYFGARGGLDDLYDVVIRCNAYYREHEVAPADLDKMITTTEGVWRWLYPLPMFSLVASGIGLGLAIRQRSLWLGTRYLVGLLLPVGCALAVFVQGMYYPYHWGSFHACLAVSIVFAIQDLAEYVPRAGDKPLSSAWVTAVLAAFFFIGYTSVGGPALGQWDHVKVAYKRLRGTAPDREALDARWNIPGFYDWTSNVILGRWLREHTRPEDKVASRNFEPAIYAVARRSSGLRFFWTAWISWDHRAYKREVWAPEDVAQIKAAPPRFVIAMHDAVAGPDSIQYFWPYGTWQERTRQGGMAIYERVSDTPQLASR